MAPSTKIFPEKIREKSYLQYKIQQKHEYWKTPKSALLLGAGCSYPVVPLGSGIIKYCQQLSFIRDKFPLFAAELHANFLAKPGTELIDKFFQEKLINQQNFEDYVTEKEKIIAQNILKVKTEELKKLRSFVPDAEWDDYEKHLVSDARYGFWMDAYSSSPRERQRLVEALIEECNPGGAYVILAHMIEKGYFNNILTTNFDDFINETMAYYTSKRVRFFADDEISQFISIYGNKPNIIKLHGDYRYANIKNTTDETLRLSKSMEEKLRELLVNLDLIVIGYNGSDYSIMNVLQQMKSPNCELLWCGLDENDVHWRVANLINTTSNSWFIKIKDFDDVISDFYYQFLEKSLAPIERAKKREDEFNRYILEISKKVKENASQSEINKLEKQELVWDLINKTNKETDQEKRFYLLSEILIHDPGFADAYMHRGFIYVDDKRDYDNAIKDFTSAIGLDDKNASAYRGRGWAYTEKGNFELALKDLDIAVNLVEASSISNFEKSVFYNTRGFYFLQTKQYAEAIADLEKALQLDPSYEYPYKHLAEVYYRQENYSIALEMANKAIDLDKNYRAAYQVRSRIYKALNLPDLAVQDEETAKTLEKGQTN
ncbi:tetratricopeptide repeat protein [Chitinophagaceae bacterium 26-R-25]|nr:tetratricopeptide repeat protein [Chitinophagaceae bacterium 26-R-25]